MAFRVGFDDVVIDTAGNALSNVEVSVYKVGTSELQTIYNERVGGATKTNPFTTSSNGRVSFFIESPQFDVKVKDLEVPERFTARTITVDRVPGGGTSGQVLVSNASGLFVPATMSGDVTISNSGITQLGSEKVFAGNISAGAVTETKIGDGAVTSRKNKLTASVKSASEDLNCTGAYQDIPGTTLEITPSVASKLLITAHWTFVFETETGQYRAVGTMNVDSVDDEYIGYTGGNINKAVDTPSVASMTYEYPLTAAKHTIKMRAKYEIRAVGGNVRIKGIGTRYSYKLVAS